MRIGVNLRPLFPGKIGGLEHYFHGLFAAMLDAAPEHEYILYGHDENLPALSRYAGRARLHRLPDPHHLTGLMTAVRDTAPHIVFHPLLFIEPLQLDAVNAVQIPDTRYAIYPEQIPPGVLADWRRKFPATARRAEVIFTISEAAAADIVTHLGVPREKIVVTTLGVEPSFSAPVAPERLAQVREAFRLPERFLYYPADTWPHKNHQRLFAALARLRDEGLTIPLVLTGFPNAGENQVTQSLHRLRLDDQVMRLGYLPRADLPALYRLATALVFPSTYEGWGMPVQEAMACATPALCGRVSSLPEVAGDAVHYFDPLDPTDMALRIREVWQDDALRAGLAERGPAQAARHTWERAARVTLAALTRAASPFFELADPLPLVSIVTPSYNQGRFIERTIQSVLEQDYPHIEYIVHDGGSSDETVEVLKKYGHRLRWISRRDRGQSDAINQGLREARGQILAYLNSDDTYTPGAIRRAVAHLVARPTCDLVYGRGWHIDADDAVLEPYPTEPFDEERLASRCFICQPTAFWRRRLHEKIGYFDEDVHYVMDYEFWMRAAKHARVSMLDDYLANSRLWEENKTLGSRRKHLYQSLEVVRRHYGRVPMHWIHSYVGFVLEEARHGGLPASLANRWRRVRRGWLTARLDARFNGTPQMLRRLTQSGAGEPLEGYADGWMGSRLERRVTVAGSGGVLRVNGDLPGWPRGRPPRLRVSVNERALGEFALTGPGPFAADFCLPPELANARDLFVRIDSSACFVPSRHGGGMDDRALSCRIAGVAVA